MKLRVGRHVPRNLYIQIGEEPSDSDIDVGRVDSGPFAEFICDTLNYVIATAPSADADFRDIAEGLLGGL